MQLMLVSSLDPKGHGIKHGGILPSQLTAQSYLNPYAAMQLLCRHAQEGSGLPTSMPGPCTVPKHFMELL